MSIDPRRSLVAGITWLVIGLAASFAAAASLWAGRVAREIVVQQHVRRLLLETDELAAEVDQAATARLAAVRATHMTSLSTRDFMDLQAAYPDYGWSGAAAADGSVVAGNSALRVGDNVAETPWFKQGMENPWIGIVDSTAGHDVGATVGDLAMPVRDSSGRTLGVVVAHLTWRSAAREFQPPNPTIDARGSAQTLILDGDGVVRVGPAALINRRWIATPLDEASPVEARPTLPPSSRPPHFARMPDGQVVLIARTRVRTDSLVNWQVQLSEPRSQVFQRADDLAERIVWISVCLGALTAIVGAFGARRLTNRLRRLARSAAAVGRNQIERIEVPGGHDEVAQLAAVLAKVLDDLRAERSELLTLSAELERRVAVRTREVERLAEESRYAAVVRERLKIARDLHDTLAHSMMAMLSEVRLLRKLQTHDPASLGDELARAEQVAHDGLNEARTAIAHMRLNAVRDTGLGPALAKAVTRFLDRTGLAGEIHADPDAARFGDERAETLFRMAEEALRNVEKHAAASRITVALEMQNDVDLTLRIADDGIGFDPAARHPGHYGLIGLVEQAHLIDAQLDIASAPGSGTKISVILRVAPELLKPIEAGHTSTTS